MNVTEFYLVKKQIIFVGTATESLPVWGKIEFKDKEYTVHCNMRGRTDPYKPGDEVGYMFYNDAPEYNEIKNIKHIKIL